ncbi:uncharacterized protein LOC126674758 [Mercurialis annua]|uniref:uncharacterized protein LOC126674758 n=1 Tax=Mercurialis annua TaxID=3986 RepID=UPI0021610675|nr:uncharacterized protein LOC126674758 [Mercurialis annua]
MADSEKLTALKKAYADIILNTAKEAAARIMASERKAQRYQRELFAAKDEALRMLIRLKQMMDSKVNETEMTALSQQRRIEELEAQLGEAEDIVKDLRSDLRELQDELENAKNSQIQPLDKQNSEDENTVIPALEENRIGTSTDVISSLPTPQCDQVILLETTKSTSNGTCDGSKCYSASDCREDNCVVCNPDFASIVMRTKEPELYRNGCTQRIRALERSLLGGNLSVSGQVDGVKNQLFIIADEEDKDICKQLNGKVDTICNVEKIPNTVKGETVSKKRRKYVSLSGDQMFITEEEEEDDDDEHKGANLAVEADNSCDARDSYAVEDNGGGTPRSVRQKRAARYNRHRGYESHVHDALHKNYQTGKASTIIDSISLEDPQPLMVPISPSNTTENNIQSGSLEVNESEAETGRTCLVQTRTSNDRLPIDEVELAECDAESAECSEFSASRADLHVASASPSNSDLKEPDSADAVSANPQPLYKYTFQRKRKKESLGSPDGGTSLDNQTLKRDMGDKQCGILDKSGLMAESSRDGRRLAQVARQLISMSGKQWQ